MPEPFRDSFLQHLMEVRKTHDIAPHLELASTTMQAGATPGTQAKLSVTPAYDLLFNEAPFIGWNPYYQFTYSSDGPGYDLLFTSTNLLDLSAGACSGFWSVGAQRSQLTEALGFISTDNLHGVPQSEWRKLRGGIFLKETSPRVWQQWQEKLQLNANITAYVPSKAIDGGGNLVYNNLDAPTFYAGLRGYRLYPKGSLRPVQKTRDEYLAEGKVLYKYTYSQTVAVTFTQLVNYTGPAFPAGLNPSTGAAVLFAAQQSPGAIAKNLITFSAPGVYEADFLCHNLRIRPQNFPAPFADAIAVGLQPIADSEVGLQNELFPWRMALGMNLNTSQQQLLTQWHFPFPMTFGANSQWNVIAQPLISLAPPLGDDPNPASFSVTMEFVFDGELILPGSGA